MHSTRALAEYINEKGISIATICKATGLTKTPIYDSLSLNGRGRPLKSDEFLLICMFLEVDPRRFATELIQILKSKK